MKKNHFLTAEQKKYIEEHYHNEQTWRIAEILGVSTKQVHTHAYNKKLHKDDDFVTVRIDNSLSWDQIQIIEDNFCDNTNDVVAKMAGCDIGMVAAYARRHNMKKSDDIYTTFCSIPPESKRFILDNYETMLTSDISKKTGVPPETIRSYAYRHGVRRDTNSTPTMINNDGGLTTEQKMFIIENYATMSNKDIASAIGITLSQLHGYSSNRKLKKNHDVSGSPNGSFTECLSDRHKDGYNVESYIGSEDEPRVPLECLYKSKYGKYFVNQNYFSSIDNEWKAYWLGFLYADGCVRIGERNGKHFNELSIALSLKDIGHIQMFLKSIQSDSPIAKRETNFKGCYSAKVQIANKRICEDLNRLGCTPSKSLTLLFPTNDIVPKHLIRHFIRGYFDGDGCIHVNTDNRCVSFQVIGTKLFLEELQNILIDECNVSRTKLQHGGHGAAWCLEYSGVYGVRSIYRYLYSGANIYMKRKFDKFDTVYSLG